jgi:hypothetical protein
MKTKLLLFSALAFVILCFNGCTPEEVETTQAQFKPLIVRVTLTNPIFQYDAQQGIFNQLNVQSLSGFGYVAMLSGNVPNHVGQNSLEYSSTALANTPLSLSIGYIHQNGFASPGIAVYQCESVNCEIIYDGQTVYNESREVGSLDGTCPDGTGWVVYYTLQ